MPELHVLRVFVDDRGAAGNHLGVMLDAGEIDTVARQQIAAELAYSETVFVEGGDRLQIFTPTTELPFAGHPLVGAAWLLDRPVLRPPAGPVATRSEPPFTWVLARPEFCPPWEVRREESPGAVEALAAPEAGHVLHWAFVDEPAGTVRARVFAPDFGVAEDPATGSAAIVLCAALGRSLEIRQGAGSEIRVRPHADGGVELGGRVSRA
ncbi:MAG: PhzF family phenazine biosynthesis protein [Solirubrobacteraceae bacterium]